MKLKISFPVHLSPEQLKREAADAYRTIYPKKKRMCSSFLKENVFVYLRHHYTNYDEILCSGYDKQLRNQLVLTLRRAALSHYPWLDNSKSKTS
jgi:hypothetical protein